MQWLLGKSSTLDKHKMPEVPFVIGRSKEFIEVPIIGPPNMILFGLFINPPQNSIISFTGVPILTLKFLGDLMESPVTVRILSVKGNPFIKLAYN